MSVVVVNGVGYAAGLDWLPRGSVLDTAREARKVGSVWCAHHGEQTGYAGGSPEHAEGIPVLAAALRDLIDGDRWTAVVAGEEGYWAVVQVGDGVIGKGLDAFEASWQVSSVLVAGLKEQTRGLRDEIAGMKELVPNVAGEDVKALARHLESLGEQLRIQRADETRKTELSGRRWKWPLRRLAAVAGVALVLTGALTQARWSVLDDGTNGWKDIVWNRHGIAIAECIKRADGARSAR